MSRPRIGPEPMKDNTFALGEEHRMMLQALADHNRTTRAEMVRRCILENFRATLGHTEAG